MKLFVLFVGLFCLLFLNNQGIAIKQNYQNFNSTDNLICFESSQPKGIWSFEKTETNVNSNQETPQSKKRFSETDYTTSATIHKINLNHNDFKLMTVSKRNLFLLYHFTHSLWQLFLQ